MNRLIRIVPPNGAVEILGIKLVGVTAENGGAERVSGDHFWAI